MGTKISELSAIDALSDSDVIAVVDTGSSDTKKATMSQVATYVDGESTTLTGKTIDGDDNTISDLALTSLKTVAGSASKGLRRDGDGIVVSDVTLPTGTIVGTSDTQTMTNKTLTAPAINSGVLATPVIDTINDANANELIKFSATASAVNEITLQNAATTTAPTISATGGDTNISLKIKGKGTGEAYLYRFSGWTPIEATLTYASADDPSYTFTIAENVTGWLSLGTKIKLTQSTGGTKYFIVTKTSYSAPNSTVTVYGGTSYDLNNEAITLPFFSRDKCPTGFPMNPDSWTVVVTDTSLRSKSNPTANTWYNLGSLSISIPIGLWDVSFQVTASTTVEDTTVGPGTECRVTLSSANNSESDEEMSAMVRYRPVNAGNYSSSDIRVTVGRNKIFSLTSKASYYLNAMTSEAFSSDTIYFRNDEQTCKIRARSAYL